MAIGEPRFPPDYILIGHLCRDVIGGYVRTGGTVFYAGITAARLGRRVGIVTAFGEPLPAEVGTMEVALVDSTHTTTLDVRWTRSGRQLRLLERAASITPAGVPEAWRSAPLVHLAPIADELSPDLAELFPNSTIVATPQGWLREWGADGCAAPRRVPQPWGGDDRISVLVLSIEDLGGDASLGSHLARTTPICVVTEGALGYTLYLRGQGQRYPSFPASEVDPTGAGDVFAAAFFIRYSETGDPVGSGRFAAAAASLSVEGAGISRIPVRSEVAARLELWSAG